MTTGYAIFGGEVILAAFWTLPHDGCLDLLGFRQIHTGGKLKGQMPSVQSQVVCAARRDAALRTSSLSIQIIDHSSAANDQPIE